VTHVDRRGIWVFAVMFLTLAAYGPVASVPAPEPVNTLFALMGGSLLSLLHQDDLRSEVTS
jgi:hypothetical protein